VSRFLSLNVERAEHCIVHQKDYIEKILKTFNLRDAKGRETPLQVSREDCTGKMSKPFSACVYKKAVGMLNYVSNGTRPDIAYAVGKISEKCNEPALGDRLNVKDILRYLISCKELCLKFRKTGEKVVMYSDADYAGDKSDWKSMVGTFAKLSGGAILWRAKSKGWWPCQQWKVS